MFEAWAETVGGVLEAAGIQGFLENVLEVYEEAETSPFLERARGLLTLWWVRFGQQEVTAGQLLEAAQQEGLEEEPAGKREKDRQARRLGTMLRQLRGRVFDLREVTVRLAKVSVDSHRRQGFWRLVPLGGPGGSAETAETPKADAGLPASAADGPGEFQHFQHHPRRRGRHCRPMFGTYVLAAAKKPKC
jgi:hypothetical protein